MLQALVKLCSAQYRPARGYRRESFDLCASPAKGISYRPTCLLVVAMNRCWQRPLGAVLGNQKGSAFLPKLGVVIVAQYPAVQRKVKQVGMAVLADFVALSLLPAPRPVQHRSTLKAAPMVRATLGCPDQARNERWDD